MFRELKYLMYVSKFGFPFPISLFNEYILTECFEMRWEVTDSKSAPVL